MSMIVRQHGASESKVCGSETNDMPLLVPTKIRASALMSASVWF